MLLKKDIIIISSRSRSVGVWHYAYCQYYSGGLTPGAGDAIQTIKAGIMGLRMFCGEQIRFGRGRPLKRKWKQCLI